MTKVLSKHGIKYQTSWGLGAALATVRYGVSEYGPMAIVGLMISIPQVIQYKVRNFFKGYEEVRQERLAYQKSRDRERVEARKNDK